MSFDQLHRVPLSAFRWVPAELQIFPNSYPNPSNPGLTFAYLILKPCSVMATGSIFIENRSALSGAASSSLRRCYAGVSRKPTVLVQSCRSLTASARVCLPKAPQLAQPTSTWNPIRGKARSSYGVTKVPKDSFSKRIAQRLGLPRFKARSSDIRIIQSPAAFYDEIRAIIGRAEQRIYLSSLYIGKDETELVSVAQTAAKTYPCCSTHR